jgi:hypothetical protein
MSTPRPRVRFARSHYAPGLEWSAYQPLLPDWEIVVGDPAAPGALDSIDVLVSAKVDDELINAGDFYRGWMSVAPDGEGSRLTLFLETRHSSERDHDVAATLDAIRMLVESEV